MLVIDGISCVFGQTRAVNNVSLSIPRGAFVGVIGRSGAGKSTLLRALNRHAKRSSTPNGRTHIGVVGSWRGIGEALSGGKY